MNLRGERLVTALGTDLIAGRVQPSSVRRRAALAGVRLPGLGHVLGRKYTSAGNCPSRAGRIGMVEIRVGDIRQVRSRSFADSAATASRTASRTLTSLGCGLPSRSGFRLAPPLCFLRHGKAQRATAVPPLPLAVDAAVNTAARAPAAGLGKPATPARDRPRLRHLAGPASSVVRS